MDRAELVIAFVRPTSRAREEATQKTTIEYSGLGMEMFSLSL